MPLYSGFFATLRPTIVTEHIRASLTRKVILWLGLPILGLSGVIIAAGYHYAIDHLEEEQQYQLQVYLQEQAQRKSQIFQTARKNHDHLKKILLDRRPASRQQSPDAEFDKLMSRWSDGTWRNFPQSRPIAEFDDRQRSTVFIGPQVQIDRELKQDILLFQSLCETYGPPWSTQFINLWINSAVNVSTGYWPGLPWALQAPASTDINQEEYGKIAQKTQNPKRVSRWTNLYFDQGAKQWMVSLVTPVDDAAGQHIATIGNDIVLNDLIAQTQRDNLPGTHNILMSYQGDLIVDSARQQAIEAAGGRLPIATLGDRNLFEIWQEALQLQKNPVPNPAPQSPRKKKIPGYATPKTSFDYQNLIAIAPLTGTDWYLVSFYPKTLIYQKAWLTMLPFILVAAIIVLLELFFIYCVLCRQIERPLLQLVKATRMIASGQFTSGKWDAEHIEKQLDLTLESDRRDEVGALSQSFQTMAQALQQSFEQLNRQNDTLEFQVQERTQALSAAIADLQLTQAQLIQSEKMSSLGQMVAGVAHEINNPVSFIHGNLSHATSYIQQILEHLGCYQKHLVTALPPEIQAHAEAIELDYIQEDLPKLLNSMSIGTDRIREIVLSLRNFSRLDEAQLKEADLHEGLDSTLLILNHRIQNVTGNSIELLKNYGAIPKISCYPGLLNQVFMNLISNAIDALEESPQPRIQITTKLDGDWVEIQIQDNGSGISPEAQAKIFDPFFTTKAIGKGTGLGLSISHQIMVDRHQGEIICQSSSAGTTFCLRLPRLPIGVMSPQ